MWRAAPPMYNVPRGYVPRGGVGYDARDVRGDPHEYEPYRQRGPSPWIPATILGVILLITGMPWMRSAAPVYPDPVIAYQAAAAVAARPAFSFPLPLPLLWIPVLAIIGFQFFGGNMPFYGDGYGYPRGGRRPGAYPGRGGYRADAYAPGYQYNRGGGGGVGGGGGWGGWWPWSGPSWNENNRYPNNYQQRGLMSMFMDYGGHWVLILLGIAVFSLVSASASALPSKTPAVLPLPPLAPETLGFPWSLFF